MMPGGGEQLRHRETEFHLADLQTPRAQIAHVRALTHQAAVAHLAGPDDLDPLFGIAGGNGNPGVTHRDVGDDETAEELHAIATHHETRLTGPCLGLRGQHARPCGLVERAGDPLRAQGVHCAHQRAWLGEGAPPMHHTRQLVGHERERERRIRVVVLHGDHMQCLAGVRGRVEFGNPCHIPLSACVVAM